MNVGILSLQGAVTPHVPHIEACGAAACEVRTAEDLAAVDALIMPGGESSTMLRVIDLYDLEKPLAEFIAAKPVWGICAGAILLARNVINPAQKSFDAVPMTANRNAYGSQLDSFTATVADYPVCFIRAPKFSDIEPAVEVLAEHDGAPVWLRYKHIMISSFHPELTPEYPSPFHKAFVESIPP